MRNTVKILKKLTIVSSFAVLASCSSGGSGTTEGVNISGQWTGILQESRNIAYDVVFDFAQTQGSVGTPGNTTSQVIFSFSVIRASDPAADICSGATFSGGTLTISSESNPATLTGDGFNAVVINNTIQGQTVIDEFDEIEIIVGFEADGTPITDDLECAFGGPINLTRV